MHPIRVSGRVPVEAGTQRRHLLWGSCPCGGKSRAERRRKVARGGTDSAREITRGVHHAQQARRQRHARNFLEARDQLGQGEAVEAQIALQAAVQMHRWDTVRVQLGDKIGDRVDHQTFGAIPDAIDRSHVVTVRRLPVPRQGRKTPGRPG
ncbi:MAG TPA: hypothetical protein VLR27_16390 [Acidimicrobiales bacterium]|nr:hypothetical protein [Acidimicrobiales bacterium]